MHTRYWTIGEIAERTGVTVRTLHHYDEIGLLSPTGHTAAGYRLYTAPDLVRLHQIRALQRLGFSLRAIAEILDRCQASPREVIDLRLTEVRDQVAALQTVCSRLERLSQRLAAGGMDAEELLKTIEEIEMAENASKYYTPEQMEFLAKRRETVGEERIREVETKAWPELIEQVRIAMDAKLDPASPRVQELAKRWMALVREFTGGDPGIAASLKKMYQDDPNAAARHGSALNKDMMEYIGKAMQAARP